ncbi:MAG: hypothetical protein ACI9P3_000486 [Bradyrhizobium sp.]
MSVDSAPKLRSSYRLVPSTTGKSKLVTPTRPTPPELAQGSRQPAAAIHPQLAETMAENARLKTIAINVMLEIAALRERLPPAAGE